MYPSNSETGVKKPRGSEKSQKKAKIFSKTQTAKVFKEFCESTSLHGYPYLFIANSIILRIIWVIVILGFTCLGGYFLLANTNEYLSSGIVTTIESSSASLDVSTYSRGVDSFLNPRGAGSSVRGTICHPGLNRVN